MLFCFGFTFSLFVYFFNTLAFSPFHGFFFFICFWFHHLFSVALLSATLAINFHNNIKERSLKCDAEDLLYANQDYSSKHVASVQIFGSGVTAPEEL